MGEINTNMSSCFGTGPRVTLLNLSPSAITELEIAEKARAEFARADAPASRLRYACIATGGAQLKRFLRYLRLHPNLTLAELHELTGKLAIHFTDDDLDALIHTYSSNGRIDVGRLASDVNVPLPVHRKRLLENVFHKISGGDDRIKLDNFIRQYCYKNDRDFVAGKKTDTEVVAEFKKKFALNEHEDGEVTLDDFVNYYGAISFGCNSDAYFDLYLRQSWNY